MTEQGTPGDAVPVPEVVARYAAYLRARTHLSAEITMERDRADARVGRDAATLVLVFRRRGENEWEPGGAEVQRGALAAVFARGQVARAVTAFLGDEPLTPASASGKGNPC